MYKESTLSNGLKIITHEDPSISVVDIQLVFRAGSRYEESHEKGYAHILEHMLMKGTVKRPTPVLIAKEVDAMGGYRNAFTGRKSLRFIMQAADNYSEELFEILSDMLLNSLIDATVLENEKKVIIEEIHKAADNTDSFFSRFIFEKLFAGHPLSSNILGDPESVTSATPDSLRAYKDKFLLPDNSAFVVSGNIRHEQVVAFVEKYFAGWSGASHPRVLVEYKPTTFGRYFHTKDTKQTLVAYSFYTAPASHDRELLTLELIRNFLNFGGSSILRDELRHKRGLIYNVGVNISNLSDAGLFSIRPSTTKPKETVEAIETIIHDLKSLFTEDLLAGVKAQTIGAFKLYIANPYRQVDFLSEALLDSGRLVTPEEYITELQSISHQEILKVIDTYLVPEKAVISAIGPVDFLS